MLFAIPSSDSILEVLNGSKFQMSLLQGCRGQPLVGIDFMTNGLIEVEFEAVSIPNCRLISAVSC